MLTTKSIGLDSTEADPKPVTGFNYAGQPMRNDEYYNGRPEHQDPNTATAALVRHDNTPNEPRVTRVERVKRKRRGWTVAAREAASKRWHQRRESKASDANTGAI